MSDVGLARIARSLGRPKMTHVRPDAVHTMPQQGIAQFNPTHEKKRADDGLWNCTASAIRARERSRQEDKVTVALALRPREMTESGSLGKEISQANST